MKGNIYPTKYGFQVRFGRELTKHFKNIEEAERFLNGIRFKSDEGTYDIRDYKRNNPLGFENLAQKWLDQKEKDIKRKSFNNLKNYMTKAINLWHQRNIKTISPGDIEDFLYSDRKISSKTRSNMKSCLHNFYKWVNRREGVPIPDMPEISFELGFRNIIDIETQQIIIDEIKKISHHINPKIHLAIHLLRTYVSIRPGELLSIKENQLNLKIGAIIIPHPKEKKPKIAYLLDDDIEVLKSIPRGLPGLHYFRHVKGISGVKAGEKFGDRYLWKWWKKACNNLGIKDIDLYGGTRHSTVTALGKICTPEEVKDASGHSSKAFERYFQGHQSRAIRVTKKIKQLSTSNQPLINIPEIQKKITN